MELKVEDEFLQEIRRRLRTLVLQLPEKVGTPVPKHGSVLLHAVRCSAGSALPGPDCTLFTRCLPREAGGTQLQETQVPVLPIATFSIPEKKRKYLVKNTYFFFL